MSGTGRRAHQIPQRQQDFRTQRANNDVGALGDKVPGFDAARYYDQQEHQASLNAGQRWPRLAQWLGFAGENAAAPAQTTAPPAD